MYQNLPLKSGINRPWRRIQDSPIGGLLDMLAKVGLRCFSVYNKDVRPQSTPSVTCCYLSLHQESLLAVILSTTQYSAESQNAVSQSQLIMNKTTVQVLAPELPANHPLAVIFVKVLTNIRLQVLQQYSPKISGSADGEFMDCTSKSVNASTSASWGDLVLILDGVYSE